MKKVIAIFLSILASYSVLRAQGTIVKVLSEVEKNNNSLSAFRLATDAVKIGNKSGIYLQNPEVEFNYLWGRPADMGKRTDVHIRQSFDFPTVYIHRNQISSLMNDQAELEYKRQLKTLLLETKMVCSDLVYINALMNHYSGRLKHAKIIANSYEARFRTGETNILELNKAKLNLLNSEKALKSLEINRIELLSQLTGLNGGKAIEFTDSVFEPQSVPDDFEQWFLQAENNNPVLAWLKKEVEISNKQVALNRSMSLPKFHGGYMSETVVNEQFKGISAGISIPLWENKNRTKYARANAFATESSLKDNKLQFYNRLKALHTKVVALQVNVNDYRANLTELDNSELLRKALDFGEVSLIDYMIELSIYYESINRLLELERDLDKSIAELNQYM